MSALSSLLVRDQVVTVRKIEEAIQKQVVGGGDLDTILLEMKLVEENVLSAYRGALYGLVPASPDEVMAVDREVIEQVPSEIAREYRIVPLSSEERVMTVAVASPPSAEAEEHLRRLLDHELVYRVTTEPRLTMALAFHYGFELTERTRLLMDALERAVPVPPPYVRPPDDNKVDGALRTALGEQPHFPDAASTAEGPATNEPATPKKDREQTGTERRDTDIDQAKPERAVAKRSASEPRTSEREPEQVRRRVARRLRGAITPKRAASAVSEATERDEILEIFFRFARQFFDCTVVFVVQEDQAIARLLYRDGQRVDPSGRVSIAEGQPLADLRHTPSPLSTRRLAESDQAAVAQAVDRTEPVPGLLLPVLLRGRVVVILYGDRAGEKFGVQDVPELLAFVPRVAESLEKLILKRKHEGYSASDSRDRASLKSAAGRVVAVAPATKPKSAYRATERKRTGTRAPALEVLGVPRSAPPPPTSSLPSGSTTQEGESLYASASTEGALGAPRVPTETLDAPVEPPHESSDPGATSEADTTPPQPTRSASQYSLQDVGSEVVSGAPPPRSRRPDPRSEGLPAPSEERVSIPNTDSIGRKAEQSEAASAATSAPPAEAPAERPIERSAEGPEPVEETTTKSTKLPRASTSAPGQPSVIVDMGEGVEELANDLMECGPDDEEPIIASLLHLGEASLPALVKRFPGPLWFDRNRPHRRLPRGRDVSAVCRALVAFGPRAIPYVGSLLSKQDPDTRFYATLLAAELVSPELLPLLGACVFDGDERTQVLALDVLRRYAAFPELEETLKKIRLEARVVGREPERRRVAARALGELRDSRALEILIDLLTSSDAELVSAGHRALVTLTRQDFGTSSRRWLSWAEKNGDRHRIEWLIEGLLHADENLRSAAADELKTLTQEYYGYHPASPKREREVAQRKYRSWWENEGRARFPR